MKYCPSLTRDINFEESAITPCCNTRGLKIPAFEFHGDPVDMDAYALYLQQVSNEIQKGGPVCRGCPQLIEAPGATDAELCFATVSINMHRFYCNCKCVYCDLWKPRQKKRPYSILPPLRSLHDNGFLKKDCSISWGGGEPTILPEFEEAAQWAEQNGYFQIVHTSGIHFSPALADLLGRGRGMVNISLDCSTPATYRRVKGVDKFQEVTGTIEKYAKAGVPGAVTLKYIVFGENNSISEIDGFLAFCARNRIQSVSYSFDFREANSGTVSAKSIIGAAFFLKRAAALGISADAFFVDAQLAARVDAALA